MFGFKNQKIYPFLSSRFTVGGIVYVPVNPSERTCDVLDSSYDPSVTNIVITDKVTNRGIVMNVIDVNPYSFYRNTCITSLQLSNNGNIGDYAYGYCYWLTSVEVQNKGDIGQYAFYRSAIHNTAKITIETGEIGAYAFSGCNAITDAIVKAKSIGSHAFSDCYGLTSAMLAEGLTSIGSSAFATSGLKSLVIPNSVTSLGKEVFYNCGKFASVSIGNSVSALANFTFAECSSLPEITIPANIESVGDYVFSGCTSLAKVNIADRQTELTLGSNGSKPLFVDCPLDDVYIGGDISYPTASNKGYSPFYRNTNLRSVKITDKETEVSPNEFYGCTNLQEVEIGDGVEAIGNYAFSVCSALKSFVLGSNVQTIGEEAFSDCTAMTSLTSHNPVPPVCGIQALDDINKWDCTIHVPAASIDTYKTAPQWKEFFFYGDIPLVIDDLSADYADVSVTASNGRIIISNMAGDALAKVYNMQGALVTETAERVIDSLSPDLYIVSVGGKTFKVMLK